jgi:hypothetical protein
MILRQFRKVFCIGLNKTGTTSLEAFFRSLGYRVGEQARGELLIDAWSVRNFKPIISLSTSADFFQDIPFSCPYTYQALDTAFAGAKFILTVRDNEDQWCDSMIRFHTKIVGKNRIPTAADLQEFSYRYEGWIYRAMKMIYNISDAEPYQRDNLIAHYRRHNECVTEYFRHRPDSLLVVNLARGNAAKHVLEFLGLAYGEQRMPHVNRSS